MKILVVDQNTVDLLLVAGALRDLGHDVRTATDRKDALTQIAQGLPHVIIVEAFESDSAGLEIVRLLRRLETPRYVYILMLTAAAGEEHLLPGYDAGVDNHIRKPASREQLAARLRAASRILGLDGPRKDGVPAREAPVESQPVVVKPPPAAAPALAAAAKPAPPPANGHAAPAVDVQIPPRAASASAGMPAAVDLVAGTNAWRDAASTLRAIAAEFFPIPIEHTQRAVSDVPATICSCITLSNVQQQLELRLMVTIDEPGARTLARHLFGDDNPELAPDMLAELGNVFMGAMKSAFSRDGMSFTGGIPKGAAVDRFERWQERCEHRQQLVLQGDSAFLAVRIGLRAKFNIVVPVARLREDMVVAKDIVHANGVLLLPSGTRLSATTAERVRRMLPNGSVELMDPDDVLDYLSERPNG